MKKLLLMNMSETTLYEFLAMLKQLPFSLLASFRLANIRPLYSNHPSSMLPLCAFPLFLYGQARGFLASNPPPHKLLTLIWHGRGILFFLVGTGFLILTACAGGGGGSGSSEASSLRPLEVNLTFAPIQGGFQIDNQSDFGDIVSLKITATSDNGSVVEESNINITEFIGGSYEFTGLDDQSNYTFQIMGTLSDGRQQEVEIAFVWEENEEDYNNGGIRPGLDTDGDRRANSVDEDKDGDGIDNGRDQCDDLGDETGWQSNPSNDNDMDGCRDDIEDTDDDNDGLDDTDDLCPTGVVGWQRSGSTDNDGDGCHDTDEDIDDDGDGLIEIATEAQLNSVRYALNGNGTRMSEGADLDITGCSNGNVIVPCNGYELVADISLAAYSGGDGWQPLGHDTDSSMLGCQGTAFNGTFEGNGFMISDLKISRSGEDCVGLFGHIAANSEIRNLTLHAETVIGNSRVGGLIGDSEGARIVSSSVVVGQVSGGGSGTGGLVGWGNLARIHASSVVVGQVSGDGSGTGGLVGDGQAARIHSSLVVVGKMVSENTFLGGLVGDGRGGMQIVSSSVVAGQVSGNLFTGGLIGIASDAQIVSSSVVVGQVSGSSNAGGLTGDFLSGKVAYSYVVSGRTTAGMLIGANNGEAVASYWDSETSDVVTGNKGEAKTTSDLQTPEGYNGIYVTWDDGVNIDDNSGVEDITKWCDRDNSETIETAEQNSDNLIWDFGTSSEYPAIRCTPIPPAEWRSWWFLNATDQPQLNQTRLDSLLPP